MQFRKGATDTLSEASVAANRERLVLAGHEMYEASTEQELLKLAEKFIPTSTGLRLVNGAHIHGLLVMERLMRGHPVCYKYYKKLHRILTGPERSVQWNYHDAHDLLADVKMIPVTACFHLIQHFLQVDEETLLYEKCDYSEGPICLALRLACHLFCCNVFVDVTQAFKAAAVHMLASSPTPGEDIRQLTRQTCDLLLIMCKDRAEPMVVKYMDAGVQLMVAASCQLRCKQTSFLHLLVNAWGETATRIAFGELEIQFSMFSNVEYLVKEFLYAGADPNAVNSSGKTAPHYVIESYGDYRSPPVKEGIALLNLFDEYGIHWDAFHGRKQSLVELVEKVRGMESLATHLKNRPSALLCVAAQAACQLDYSVLPRRMQRLVDIHKPQLPPSTTLCEKLVSLQRSLREAASSPGFHSFGSYDVYSDDCMNGNEGYASDDCRHYDYGDIYYDSDDLNPDIAAEVVSMATMLVGSIKSVCYQELGDHRGCHCLQKAYDVYFAA